jgi:hypothetical protein
MEEKQWDADALYMFWEDVVELNGTAILSRNNKTQEILVHALIGIFKELEKLNNREG